MTITEQSQELAEKIKAYSATELNLHDFKQWAAATYALATLTRCGGNRSQAAKVLGLHRNRLSDLLRALAAQGYTIPAYSKRTKHGGRRKSIVDHRGIELRRSATAWRQQQ